MGKQAEYGSDVIIDLLKAYDIKYVALNPGYTLRGMHDSLVNYGGNKDPELILCCHEETAVSMAHGYAKATGKPMATIVHNLVGLQHATMAIYNAWCDRVPLIVLGGNGPQDTTKRRLRLDWIHTALIPGNMVRDFVKWDDQPFSVGAFPQSFARAYKLAMTPPKGPVYICYDVALQEEKLTAPVPIPDVKRFSAPSLVQADPKALQQAAEWLVRAENPVILADYVSRNLEAAEALVKLAEELAIPVIDPGRLRVNFLPGHPLNVTGAEKDILGKADVILALDTVDLQSMTSTVDKATGLCRGILLPGAKVIQISLSGLLVGSWANDSSAVQPVDLDILADTRLALPQLTELCHKLKVKEANKEKYARRFERVKAIHDQLRAKWREQAAEKREDVPIALTRVCEEMWPVISKYDWLLVNNKARSWEQRLWEWSKPNQWLGHSTGGGLGYGIGASIGAALAFKGTDKLCIDLESDGEFLYTDNALWTAAHHQIPLLVVILNNRAYGNSQSLCEEVAETRGRPRENRTIGNSMKEPPIDFASLARSFGLYGEGPIERPQDVRPAVERAVRMVMEKKAPALVDIITPAR